MRTNRWFVFGVLMVFCIAAVAVAQEGGQRGNRRGGGFGGGFRGGFGGPGGFGGGSKLMLLGMEEVQKEIEIDDDQKQQITTLNEELRGNPDERPNIREMSEEEQQKYFAERRKKYEEAEAKLSDILLPHQLDRLDQLSIQQRGVSALADPKVAEKLTLSDEQKEKLKTVQEEVGNTMREKAQQIFADAQAGGGGNQGDAFAKLAELRKEGEQKILDVLTDDQKKQFEEMKGEAFEFPRPNFGGGRGGRGGGGGRGARPQGENDNPGTGT